MRLHIFRTVAAVLAAVLLATVGVATIRPKPAAAASGVLYDQTDNPAANLQGTNSQYDASTGFSQFAGDDFEVPDATTWSVDGLEVEGRLYGTETVPSFTITFYDNDVYLPGTQTASLVAVPTMTTGASGDFFTFDFTFPAVSLAAGRHWVSVVANLAYSANGDTAMSFDWANDTLQTISPAAVKQSHGVVTVPCQQWTTRTDCYPDTAPDQLFTVLGNVAQTTTSALSSSPNPSSYGTMAWFTDIVCPSPFTREGGLPSGVVRFTEGSVTLIASSLFPSDAAGPGCREADFLTSAFSPGTHLITAVYDGNANLPGSTASVTQVVNCAKNVSGSVGAQSISGGSACFTNATVNGGVNISQGANVYFSNSTVGGALTATSPGTIGICGGQVKGQVSISGASGFVLVGGDTASCPGVKISGSVLLNNNHGLRLGGNQVLSGAVSVTNNNAIDIDPIVGGPAGTVITRNTIGGKLACSGNVPAASNAGVKNTVGGARTGECASATF
jgi:Big-like domain-containing protein